MISEAYRLLVVLPFLEAHPDIFIHVYAGQGAIEKYHTMFGLPRYHKTMK